MRTTFLRKGMCIVLALVMLSTVILGSVVTDAADVSMNAEFVSCTIPNTVLTDEVFQAHIVMRNTGDKSWGHLEGQIPVTLVSKNPEFNTTWGTYFIIQGQHDAVEPGETFTFTSWLRAPRTPGVYNFSWQCLNDIPTGGRAVDRSKPVFGDIMMESIEVTQRQEAPPPQPTHQEGLLDASDFEYAGSLIPPGLEGHESTYTDSGLTLRNVAGEKHLLLRTGTYNHRLYEIRIPDLVKIAGEDYSAVKRAEVVRDWGELSYGKIGDETVGANGGMWLDESSDLLYWTHCNSYFCGGPSDFPQLAATQLNEDGTKTNVGYWYIPNTPAKYKSYWGGVIKLPQDFADTYTAGRDLALGFGGYYSICGTASRGPALGAIARPGNTGSTLDLVEMMTYPDPIACPRDGNYFSNVGYWCNQPENPWEGKWTGVDGCRAGVFIHLPDKKGYLAFSHQAIGRIGYDYGGYNSDGYYQNVWYFYDIEDLGAAAKGDVSPYNILPSSFTTVQYPLQYRHTWITGACFDEETRLLYVYAKHSIPGNYGYKPIIHAYRVKGSSSETGSENESEVYTNHGPDLAIIGPKTTNEGTTLSFTIQGSDSDGDSLTYSATGLPPGAAFNSVTRNFSWTPTYQQSGNHTIRFTVSDGLLSDYEDVTITVNDVQLISTNSITADHNQATLSALSLIPVEWINKAKEELHIVYGHTSHGSQITDGMAGLAIWKGSLYAWNGGGSNGALDLRNTPSGFGTDLGNGSWPTITRNYLDAHPDTNVVMWSWCGQVSSASEAYINTYLNNMSQLEEDYPNVKFVYMTGHLDGSGLTGNLHIRNEQIRKYCRDNGKILFDFADIESYNPDGSCFLNRSANDECRYDSNGNGRLESSDTGNWATEWQNSHTQNVDWYNCGSAHSKPLNANMKAYAAWYLWARLAGWNGVSGNGGGSKPINHPPVLASIGSKTVDEGQNLSFTITASDQDSDALFYSASGLPSGAIFDTSTRTFTWTPSHSQSGAHTVQFTVNDGLASDYENVRIIVNDVSTGDVSGGGNPPNGGGTPGENPPSGGGTPGDNPPSGGTPVGNPPSGGGTPMPLPATSEAIVSGPNIAIEPVVSGGTARSVLTGEDITKAFLNASADASGNRTITLDVSEMEGAKAYVQELPAIMLNQGSSNLHYEINTAIADVRVPCDMFSAQDTANKKNIGISIAMADKSTIPTTLQEQIGNRPIVELKALADGSQFTWNNPNAPITIEVDYILTAEELKNPDLIVVWYIDGKGKVHEVPSGRYDPVKKKVVFTTTHFSQYAIAYAHKTYTDLSQAYGRQQIEALASKGFYNEIITGDQFNPNRNITRAEFLHLLVTALDLHAPIDSNFSDVEPTDYYYHTVGIAKQLGITLGIGNNKVGANLSITRQDMSTLLVRALAAAGKNYPDGVTSDLTVFTDLNKIAAYAKQSLATLVRAGVLVGYNNSLDPIGSFNMQQAAIVIYRVYKR